MTLVIHASDLGDYEKLSVNPALNFYEVGLVLLALDAFAIKKIGGERQGAVLKIARDLAEAKSQKEQSFAAIHPKSLYSK